MKKWHLWMLAVFLLLTIHPTIQAQCSGCTTTISTATNTSYTVNTGEKLCVTSTGILNGKLTINGGTVCNQGIVNTPTFVFNGGVVNNFGQFTCSGPITLRSGSVFDNNTGAKLKVNCALYADIVAIYRSAPGSSLIVAPYNGITVLSESPLPICAAQSTILNAGGATVYSWQPASGLSATTGSSVIASPSVTTTYTVTGTGGCGTGGTAIIIVSVDPTSPPEFTSQLEAMTPYQQWSKVLGSSGDERSYAIRATPDGGYIVVGMAAGTDGDVTGSHGGNDCWVIKLDKAGNIAWKNAYGGSGAEGAWSVDLTSDGGYIVGGLTFSNDGQVTGNHGGGDFWLVKLNSSGTLQWQKTYGGTGVDWMQKVRKTADGGYIMVGGSTSNNGDATANYGALDYWVVKVNSSGTLQWQKNLGGSADDFAYDVIETSAGNFIVAGSTKSNNGQVTNYRGGSDYWITKLNSSGTLQWQKTYGSSSDDEANAITQLTNGGYVITGYAQKADGDVQQLNGFRDAWTLKIDENGTLQWQNSYGGSAEQTGFAVQSTTDGGCVIGSYTSSQDNNITTYGGSDAIVFKLDANGNALWNQQYGGSNNEAIKDMIQTPDGGFAFVADSYSNDGEVGSNLGQADFWINKLSEPYAAVAGLPYTFQCTSSGINTYAWKVNESTVGTSNNLTYPFPTPGIYPLQLQVNYASCGLSSKTKDIRVVALSELPKQELQFNISYADATSPNYNNGTLSAAVSGGTPPYTYAWSNGANTKAISNVSVGFYNLTVTDANGKQTSSYVPMGAGITWDFTPTAGNMALASDGKSVARIVGVAACYAAAQSVGTSFGVGNPWMAFKVDGQQANYMIGLAQPSSANFQYKIMVENQVVYAVERGSEDTFKKTDLGAALPGDTWSIEFFDATIFYKKNGITQYVVGAVPVVTWKLYANIFSTESAAKILKVQSSLKVGVN
jgi:hypothetical protein